MNPSKGLAILIEPAGSIKDFTVVSFSCINNWNNLNNGKLTIQTCQLQYFLSGVFHAIKVYYIWLAENHKAARGLRGLFVNLIERSQAAAVCFYCTTLLCCFAVGVSLHWDWWLALPPHALPGKTNHAWWVADGLQFPKPTTVTEINVANWRVPIPKS